MGALCAEKYEVGIINLPKKESAANILLFDPHIKNFDYFRLLLGSTTFCGTQKYFLEQSVCWGAELKPVSQLILQLHSIAKLANTHPATLQWQQQLKKKN